jgi:hypothetical protein
VVDQADTIPFADAVEGHDRGGAKEGGEEGAGGVLS